MDVRGYLLQQLTAWSKALLRFMFFFVWVFMLSAYLSYHIGKSTNPQITVVWSLCLGGLLSLILYLLTEVQAFDKGKSLIFQVIPVVMTLVFYQFMPKENAESEVWTVITFFALFSSLIFMVPLVPFLRKRAEPLFLKYNMQVLENFLESALMAAILFAGLSLAVVSIDALFNTHIGKGDMYAHLAIWIFLFLHSVNFLSNFPGIPLAEEQLNRYKSRFYKVFINYVAIPVTIIYTAILYAYSLKLLMVHEDLKNWVVSLCAWYGGIGLFTYLCNRVYLLHNESLLSRFFNKYFFLTAIVPLILFLYACYDLLAKRGITEESYYLSLIFIFALFAVVFYQIKKEGDLRLIPTVIIFLSLFSIASGPFNAWKLSTQNQKKRLLTSMEKNGLLVEGKLVANKGSKMKTDDALNFSLSYLDRKGELSFLKSFDKDHLLTDTIQNQMTVSNKLGISSYNYATDYDVKNIYHNHLPVISVNDFSKLLPLVNKYSTLSDNFEGIKVNDKGGFDYYARGEKKWEYKLLKEDLVDQKIKFSTKSDSITVFFQSLTYRVKNDGLEVEDITGVAFQK